MTFKRIFVENEKICSWFRKLFLPLSWTHLFVQNVQRIVCCCKCYKQKFEEIVFFFSAISVAPILDLTKQFTHPETAPPNLIKLVEAIERTGNTFLSLNVV